MSHIEFTGNLAADPEVAFGKESGRPYARIQIVVNHRQRNADGTWSDGGTIGYRVTVFDRLAENVGNSLHKGDRVVVAGDYTLREYTTGDGSKGYAHEITGATIGVSLDFATVTITRNPKAANNTEPADTDQADVPDTE